jgi:hypothetical protein
MAENKLDPQHQVFIVQSLATYERPKAVQDTLKQNFDVEITLQGVLHYDISNPDLLKKWKTLFNSTRAKFLKDSMRIPIANKSYRLQKLQRMFETEESAVPQLQNKKRMQAILEQAAKESGDAFTNKQKLEHTGKDGAPIETKQAVDLSKLSTDELVEWKKLMEKTNG